MSFNAKLHIQGVGCYVPLHETENRKVAEQDAKRLLVIFPDGTPRNNPPGLCLHLNFVQFSNAAYAKGLGLGTELEGYGTRFLSRELLTVDTDGGGGPLAVDLRLVPKIEDALPDSQAADRSIDPPLLIPEHKDPHGRVMGKLRVDVGSVSSNDDFKSKWYFKDGEEHTYSNVVTVTYKDITKFELGFRKLVPPDEDAAEIQSTIPLKPPGNSSELEVWVRNYCDSIPAEEMAKHPAVDPGRTFVRVVIDRLGIKQKIELGEIETDEDFVLNYKVRGSANSGVEGPVPKRAPDVGGEQHKCLGSQ